MTEEEREEPQTVEAGIEACAIGEDGSVGASEGQDEAPVDGVGEEGVPRGDVSDQEDDGPAAQFEDMNDKYLRLMAEFDNYKRRTSREYERLVASANERLMLEIIEVREGFERAIKAAGEGGDHAQFVEGIRLIYAKLDEILGKNGLAVFADVGDEFDPKLHDAMMKVPHQDVPEDHIAEICGKGYKLRDRVIKHARVIVSGGPAG